MWRAKRNSKEAILAVNPHPQGIVLAGYSSGEDIVELTRYKMIHLPGAFGFFKRIRCRKRYQITRFGNISDNLNHKNKLFQDF